MTHGFVVVIVRSDAGGNGRKTTLVLSCERSGKYKPYKNQLICKVTGTKKCDCPFRLRGRLVSTGDGWRLNVVYGYHNHEVAENLEGHAYAGHLNVDELSLVNDMTQNMVKPRNISLTLKEHNKDNVTTIKQIYNARQSCQTSLRGPRTELQHLMKLMERDKVESAHSRLKNLLQDSRVSRNALALIDDEKQRINYVGIDSSACGCTLRNTHGLSCACQLARYVCIGYQLPITEVHTHWMKLTFNDGGIDGPGCGLSIQPESDEVLRRFEELDLSGKVVLKSEMREVAFPETTTMCPPPDKVKTTGGVTILDQLPSVLHPFIVRADDVEADGNCGYRAIAASLGFGEDSRPVMN
ncbi:OTU domain [Sesbania bispinosa]|nr:OTU domain [Sesbania bispinosa]